MFNKMASTPILHVLVIGFHHKKGCQIEYSHPPLMSPEADPHSPEVPSQWKHLPSLALPDGSHNYTEDTAFFHLPALDNPRKTVFGISCFRQISTDQLVNKTSDITRGTVQKSVCVLSTLPLYGQIQVKMSLITEAYFREGDFTRLDLIHQTYENLNACLSDDMLHTQQLYVGLSARNFVQQFKQKALILFKLMLLEKKVLFFQSPVKDLCAFFLTLLSLHPGMLEDGLGESARMVPADTPPSQSPVQPESKKAEDEPEQNDGKEGPDDEQGKDEDNKTAGVLSTSSSIMEITTTGIKGKLSGAINYITGYNNEEENEKRESNGDKDEVSAKSSSENQVPSFKNIAAIPTKDFGLPLNIFTGGNLCHPYLSLSYIDILTQPSIHGYLIGATNVLFKQKKGLAQVVVDINQDKYELSDPDLKKALTLTTPDLRFIDNIIRHVSEVNPDIFLDGVGWEGGDEWVRAQFRYYLACLLRTSLASNPEEEQESSHFNPNFMAMWKQTKNYHHWRDQIGDSKVILDVVCGHPFAGNLSVTDMKLHFSNTMSNSESGKKVSQVVSNTSKVVAGGINSAKGAFSSLLTSLRQPVVRDGEFPQDQTDGSQATSEVAAEAFPGP